MENSTQPADIGAKITELFNRIITQASHQNNTSRIDRTPAIIRIAEQGAEIATQWKVKYDELKGENTQLKNDLLAEAIRAEYDTTQSNLEALQKEHQQLKDKYDNILATESGHSSQTENVWQSGYAAGHDAGYDRVEKEWKAMYKILDGRYQLLKDNAEKIRLALVMTIFALKQSHNEESQPADLRSELTSAICIGEEAISAWKETKEATDPCPNCGKELSRDRNLCCRECGKEVERA